MAENYDAKIIVGRLLADAKQDQHPGSLGDLALEMLADPDPKRNAAAERILEMAAERGIRAGAGGTRL